MDGKLRLGCTWWSTCSGGGGHHERERERERVRETKVEALYRGAALVYRRLILIWSKLD
jgi:hypothetical protein